MFTECHNRNRSVFTPSPPFASVSTVSLDGRAAFVGMPLQPLWSGGKACWSPMPGVDDNLFQWGIVSHTSNPSTRETGSEKLPQVWGYLDLHSETPVPKKQNDTIIIFPRISGRQIINFCVFICVPRWIYASIIHSGACRVQKGTSDPLELEWTAWCGC